MIVDGRDDERTSGAGGTRPLALAIPPPVAARRRNDTALNRACTTRRAGPVCVRREPLVHMYAFEMRVLIVDSDTRSARDPTPPLLIAHHAEEVPPPRVTCCCARPDLETRRIGRVARRGVSRDAASPIPHLRATSVLFRVRRPVVARRNSRCGVLCDAFNVARSDTQERESFQTARSDGAARSPTRSPYPLRRGVRRGGVPARADLRERPAIAVCRLCHGASWSARGWGAGRKLSAEGGAAAREPLRLAAHTLDSAQHEQPPPAPVEAEPRRSRTAHKQSLGT